ncbi:MAG: class I SAM-dependent methyltransferase [bacterium]|nr:class I SAM-dependent methyltransferase [bacterium]
MAYSRVLRWLTRRSFGFWQRLGLHVVPNHYYYPIPDTAKLPDTLWDKKMSVAGLDLREEQQLALLLELTRYAREFDRLVGSDLLSPAYSADNPSLTPLDASAYYCLIRLRKPKHIVEIGGGYSSLIAAEALKANSGKGSQGHLTVVEPYPPEWLKNLPSLSLIQKPAQDVPLKTFAALSAGDILFIDSSHVLTIGSDVHYEILEILPRLQKGVAVHLHDIFIPNEYPKEWIIKRQRFWTEQYLLQAFLSGNTSFEVRLALNYLSKRNPPLLAQLSKHHQATYHPGSFWFERVGG